MMHLILHFSVPLFISLVFFRKQWQKAYLVIIATMLVDLDHFLAVPIYDAIRCSIGFHPLHTTFPIIGYGVLCFIKKTRWIGVGLMIHMALDSVDCQMTNGVWFT